MKFAHLHNHSHFSVLDGLSKPEEMAKKAKELGQEYLGLTDHGSIDGVIDFQKACEKEGIKSIIGCEGYIINYLKSKEKTGHITFLVKNEVGWKNLCTLLTKASLTGFYRKPRMDFDSVLNHCEGLIIMTACANSFLNLPYGVQFFHRLHEEIKDDLYLEIMSHDLDMQRETNELCLKLHKETGVKLVATHDSHYVNQEDYKAQEVLLAIQRKAKWHDKNRWKFDINNLYLCNSNYIIQEFKEHHNIPVLKIKQACKNTVLVAKKCENFKIHNKKISLPEKKVYKDKSSDFNLKVLCLEGYKDLFQGSIKENKKYYKRFKMEYKVIKQLELSDYFLIVYDLLEWCRENDILIGPGRGSSAGSLIAYLLKITTIDPIPNKLIFERFLNVDRGDMADIDIDIPDIKREQVRNYLIDTYGENNISGISTFMRMQSRGVIRDVSRVFNVPLREVDIVAKAIDKKEKIKDVLEKSEGIAFNRKYPEVVEIAQKLEGTIRGASQHASAVIVSKYDLTTSGQCNLVKRKGHIVVNWEKYNAENQGLLKLDLLGSNQLTIIKECTDLVEKDLPEMNYIETNDEKIFDMISRGDTAGIFQMNTPHITKFVKEMGIESFRHMADVIALVRPGPLESGMAKEYIERKHGKKWLPLHDIYEGITKDSYGQAIFQEDLMFVITKMAGLKFTIADKIRKIIGKKRDVSEMLPYKEMFVDGCIQQETFSKQEAEDFWHVLESAASYLFNLAHSVAYAQIGYQTAWLKEYHPLEFLCANMTFGKDEKKEELIKWGFSKGIKINLPKIGSSDALKWKIKEGQIYAPFLEIKGFGEKESIKASKMKRQRQLSFFNIEPEEDENKPEKILEAIGAYSDKIPEAAQSYFSFPISDSLKITKPKLYELTEGTQVSNEDAISCNFNPIGVIDEYKKKISCSYLECHKCGLSEQCEYPVSFVHGKLNIMIIGEAPGKEENREIDLFVGKAGQVLWREANIYGFKKSDFFLTNVCKCFPSKTKRPSKKEIRTCFPYLLEEIKSVKPKFILAFGNTNLFAFLNQEKGIMSKSGETVWIEKIGAWVTFCIHPASTLYNTDNIDLFETSIKSFFENIINAEVPF